MKKKVTRAFNMEEDYFKEDSTEQTEKEVMVEVDFPSYPEDDLSGGILPGKAWVWKKNNK